jgi:hypothetical protein
MRLKEDVLIRIVALLAVLRSKRRGSRRIMSRPKDTSPSEP